IPERLPQFKQRAKPMLDSGLVKIPKLITWPSDALSGLALSRPLRFSWDNWDRKKEALHRCWRSAEERAESSGLQPLLRGLLGRLLIAVPCLSSFPLQLPERGIRLGRRRRSCQTWAPKLIMIISK